MSPACCLLTKPGLTFVVVLSLRCFGGGDNTHFSSKPCHQLESCFRFFQAYCGIYAFRRFERGWTTSTGTTFPFSVSAVGWCRIASLGNLPGTTRASQRLGWSNVAPCTTAFAEERATSTQMVSAESAPQCSHRICKAGRSASR